MAKMEGWVSINRKILKWRWYSNIPVKTVFIHLLLTANHQDNEWEGIKIKRGQLITGRESLSEQTGLSEQQIRTALKKLKSTNEITIETTSKNSIITICKYNDYQDKKNRSSHRINQDDNQQLTNNQPTTNQQSTTNNNNSNNGNNDDNDNKIQGDSFNTLLKKSGKQIQKLEAKIDIVYPFVTDQFINAWSLWLDHRKALKKPYRSGLSQQTALKKLSEFDEDTAIKMINQSIENDWQGLFPLKNQINGASKKTDTVNARREAFARRHGTSPDN